MKVIGHSQQFSCLPIKWIRCDNVYLTCSKNRMGSQLSLPHKINKKLKWETKNKLISMIVPVQSCYREGSIIGKRSLFKVERICWKGRFWAWSERAKEWRMMRVWMMTEMGWQVDEEVNGDRLVNVSVTTQQKPYINVRFVFFLIIRLRQLKSEN